MFWHPDETPKYAKFSRPWYMDHSFSQSGCIFANVVVYCNSEIIIIEVRKTKFSNANDFLE